MLFNSLSFLIFFPLVTGLYFSIPHRFRWALLLLASCFFYMAFIPIYILILFITILIDYWAGIFIEEAHDQKKTVWLVISIISTCLVLFVFKYYDFFIGNFTAIAQLLHLHYPLKQLHIILPIGLSFHTFQSLSYVIEVFRGKQIAERHFGIYALYVMFFPQLVAGPIERPQHLLHQFYQEHRVDLARITYGLQRILWGLFLKVVIADRLALIVNPVYNDPTLYSGPTLIIATVCFAFQIFCDFAGYSEIALGTAKVLGFTLMENFRRPYFARSMSEFWARWHISLSTWFKDYLYIPLGGNKVTLPRWCFNILVVFLISGLWHGANWTFVVWGLLNGSFLIIERLTTSLRINVLRALKFKNASAMIHGLSIVGTFILANIGWVFFRANSIPEALYILTRWIKDLHFHSSSVSLPVHGVDLSITLACLMVMGIVHFVQEHHGVQRSFYSKPLIVRWAIYAVLLWTIILFGVFNKTQFIYFQF